MAISEFAIRNCIFSIKCEMKWEDMESDMRNHPYSDQDTEF